MKKKEIINFITQGRYSEASSLINIFDSKKIEDLIMEISYEVSSITIYSFICKLIAENESVDLHILAASVMINPLSFIEGAYETSLYHVRRAIELDSSDVSLKEMIIFLHLTPDEVVSKDEAIQVASEILIIDPNNKAVLDLYEKLI
ncbi:hypothetical protein ACFSTH_11610 [Paenibacillus yanchengensis]|uniref:Immunity protein 30 domain-containing protein n=1 Tax=Paenibacillus yanchengensis TaxID=2035833 RepID=A0ABW4YIR3_9BACL